MRRKPRSIASGLSKAEDVRWPAQVQLLLSALDAASDPSDTDDANGRVHYRVNATVGLFSAELGMSPHAVYTREIDSHGVAFIGTDELPLGQHGSIRLPAPDGEIREISGTVMMSRALTPGWFEGTLHFKHEEIDFHSLRVSTYRPEPRKILIVDDDDQVARLIGLVLESGGYHGLTAQSGAQALGRLAHEHVDVIITDLHMSCGDGLSLIEAVRRTSRVPVIVISGFAHDYGVQFRALQVASVLPKPIDTAVLLAQVRDCLSQSMQPAAVLDHLYRATAS